MNDLYELERDDYIYRKEQLKEFENINNNEDDEENISYIENNEFIDGFSIVEKYID